MNNNIIVTCKLCGQVIHEIDGDYAAENSWACDDWISDLRAEHEEYDCLVALERAWADWREECNTTLTPHAFLEQKFQEGMGQEEMLLLPTPPDRRDCDWECEIVNIFALHKERILRKVMGRDFPEGVKVRDNGYGITDADNYPWTPRLLGVHYRRAAAMGIKL